MEDDNLLDLCCIIGAIDLNEFDLITLGKFLLLAGQSSILKVAIGMSFYLNFRGLIHYICNWVKDTPSSVQELYPISSGAAASHFDDLVILGELIVQ